VRYFWIFLFLTGCNHQSNDPSASATESVAEDTRPAAPEHNYAVYMDDEYGYQPAISENQVNDGQVATTLIMLKYLGERNGKYQLFTKQNDNVMTVMECQKPCEFIKLHHIVNGMGVVKTEVMEAAPDSIGKLAFDDAINGQLQQFVKEENGKKYTAWLDGKSMKKTYLN